MLQKWIFNQLPYLFLSAQCWTTVYLSKLFPSTEIWKHFFPTSWKFQSILCINTHLYLFFKKKNLKERSKTTYPILRLTSNLANSKFQFEERNLKFKQCVFNIYTLFGMSQTLHIAQTWALFAARISHEHFSSANVHNLIGSAFKKLPVLQQKQQPPSAQQYY